MARPRLFDEERALDAAMRAFWAHGYDATSTQDLCEATGLGRSSIYNTFSSKQDLFRRSLTRYMDMMTGAQLALLADEGRPAVERIRALFAKVVEDDLAQRGNGRSPGCLTVNTTVELAGRDPDIASALDRDLARRLDAFRAVIESARRDGDITSGQDADSLARFLNAVIGGMRVSAQGGADRAALEAIAATAMEALTGRAAPAPPG
ncbi:TetR/AcrR family transcriptional regulator [Streptomyces sp. SP18CS02]|uniref:TetR/AcrR family transcriptional regulator n=1 Tax=Streptomyces sp. SP18CS02 TaxID=3002531 RepID=UPI002E78450C|nr:helix-turn-helix domain-containing protein [Streptomyces sp. SP18CS02]MEE1756138.1 helix-turn-helix domain containing protein [Streptomyces sp. SP18CS02]